MPRRRRRRSRRACTPAPARRSPARRSSRWRSPAGRAPRDRSASRVNGAAVAPDSTGTREGYGTQRGVRRAQDDPRDAAQVRSAPRRRLDPRDDLAQGHRELDRSGLARLHRAVDRDRGALRDRDGRVTGPRPPLHVVRHPVSLHRVEDRRRVRPVAVTGLGVVSPFGAGVKAFWEGISGGTCAIRPITLIDTEGFRCRIGAEVPDSLGGSARRSRADRFALAAAREALDDAGIGRVERADTALIVGAVGGGMLEAEAWYWQRPRETVVTACSSGAASLAMAADLVRDGVVPVALAGGIDALTRICFMGFNTLKLLDPTPCRPFDRDRRGMSIGEGGAFVVLENVERARARDARVYAELTGYGMSTDAFHVTSPHPEGEGMVRAIRAALAQAGIPAAAVGYANAHGTATPQNDRIEARALREVFGEGRLLVSSTKSMIGHTMAAAGTLEAVATVLALDHEIIPPTARLAETDPDIPFDCVPCVAREVAVEHAISNSFGFGGQNVTLVFRRRA